MPAEITQAINEILPQVLSLIALVVIYYIKTLISKWQPQVQKMIDANVAASNQAIIKSLGRECLAYAEKELPKASGAEKLQAAFNRFNAKAISLGLTNLTSDTVRAAIEAAWLEIWGTQPPKTTDEIIIPDVSISVAQLKQVVDALAAKQTQA
jgi:hypothetical protein